MEQVRFGLVGTGRITDWVLKGAFEDPRFVAQAVCSRTVDSARTFASKYDIPDIYTDIDDMASSPDIDAVYIGTPNHTHADIAIKCLNKGKHVLCEKPFASDAAQAEKMVAAARDNGVIIMEAMISTLSPNFRKTCELIKEIGTIRRYAASFCQYSSKYDALKNGVVASCFKPGTAGAVRDIGVYVIYPLVALFGRPETVRANLRTFTTEEGVSDVHGTAYLGYEEMDATITWSKICDSFVPTEISGKKGNIVLDEIHIARKAEIIPHGAPSSGQGPKAGPVVISEGLPYNEYYYEFKEFADLIEQGKTESQLNSHETSITALEIIDEILVQ
jgi:predicted dehydrogenase